MPFNRSLRPEERGAAAKRSDADTEAARHFYSDAQSRAYTSPANAAIQRDLTRHALELLQLRGGDEGDGDDDDEVLMLLDVGAGSGLSTAAACAWSAEQKIDALAVAFDISASMLSLAASRAPSRAVEFYCGDAGQRFPLRGGQFRAAIGISMLQWLPPSGLETCFASLYEQLSSNVRSRAVFQVYPPSIEYVANMESIARRAGFGRAETFVSLPHTTTAKKWFFSVEREPLHASHASNDANTTHSSKKQEVCVFGRRFQRRCALQWLDDTSDHECSVTTGLAAIRERLEKEHVKEAWHVWRKYRRASDVRAALEGGVQMHEQAKRSLELWESDKCIGQALEEHFKSTDVISYALLLKNAREVVTIVHAAYTVASKTERSTTEL